MKNKSQLTRGRFLLVGVIILTTVVNVSLYSFISSKRLNDASPTGTTRNVTFVNWENGTQDGPVQQTTLKDHGHGTYTLKKRKHFPECIIMGTKKSGTSALIYILGIHPNICVKYSESHFFSLDSIYRRGLEFYRNSMPHTYPYQTTIEKTPSYWTSERAAKRFQQFNKNIKLIVTLRHPVKRMISDYRHLITFRFKFNKTRYNEIVPDASLTFEDLAIDKETGKVNTEYQPLNVSMYYMHLTHWLEYFPREQIHIVDGDNLIVNPIEEIEKIETFLGLEHRVTNDKVYFDSSKGFYCKIKSGKPACMPDAKGHIHPDVDPLVLRKLQDFFRPLNEQLFSLLGRRFTWD